MSALGYATSVQPFALDLRFKDPIRQMLLIWFRRPLEQALGLDRLNRHYAEVTSRGREDFLTRALAVLNVGYDVDGEALARIPRTGPLIVVSNHPFGGLDGIILVALIRRVRPDAKVMANFLLSRIPELRDIMLFVDPFGGKDAARNNLPALRQSLAHVRGGNALIVFPAGEVSHMDLARRAVLDPKWSDTVARIVRHTESPVLPVYFHGNNSKLFSLLGMVHPLLRTAMLPRELIRKEHSRVAVEIGTVVPFKKLASFASNDDLTAYLRLRTYILQTRRADMAVEPPVQAPAAAASIAEAEDPALMREEVAGLPEEARLLETPEFTVYLPEAGRIPHTMREIGRLREITFRATHEGTGKPLDIDEFDAYYLHLFCWSRVKQEVVGAYRLGLTDEILSRRGVAGLYTRTLFRYDRKLLAQMGPAVELGRSFVRGEYQRSYAPLLLLWKGIGAFVVKNPRYQVLFGPVSINSHYQSFSRQLIMTFLRMTSCSDLARRIRANHPPRIRPLRSRDIKDYSTVVRDIEEVSDLVQEVEADGKGVPVLLRQYMKLSARLLGFNIDPDFGDVLDGLMVVDLRRIEARLVERFCGKEGARLIRACAEGHRPKNCSGAGGGPG